MEIGGFRGSDLMYMLICSKIFAAKSCGGVLRLREGLFLFMDHFFP